MTGVQLAVVVVLGVIAWVGLALCVAIAIGLTIREANRRAAAAGDHQVPAGEAAPAAPVVPLAERRGVRLDVHL